MTIREKLEKAIKDRVFNFTGIDFDIYKTDLVTIYDRVHGNILFQCLLSDYTTIPNELLDIEPKRYDFRRIDTNLFCIDFYLNSPDKIEQPISAKTTFV